MMIDTDTLETFRDIVKEVIKAENDALREEINRAVSPIHQMLEDCHDKLRNHEHELTALDTRMLAMEANCKEMSNRYEKLQLKIDDLENRGRRCNLRILGVPEGLEQGNPSGFIAELLYRVLGDGPNGLEKPPVLDRAHRTATRAAADGGRPRPFIVCVHHYQEKERIQRLAREKGRLEFHGKQILIFPDYSADLTRRRAAFNEVKVSLRQQEGVRYGLLYPARLRVSYNGETKVYSKH
uniref:L1 transposable element RRM domain-containing protein n=1 Tax=Knipowitschia caucasica TaxID=637954 RepID=A0AAV2JUX5_KNICA